MTTVRQRPNRRSALMLSAGVIVVLLAGLVFWLSRPSVPASGGGRS